MNDQGGNTIYPPRLVHQKELDDTRNVRDVKGRGHYGAGLEEEDSR
jgi:hypothetical protein